MCKKTIKYIKTHKFYFIFFLLLLLSFVFLMKMNQKVKIEKTLEGFWMIDLEKSNWARVKTFDLINYTFDFKGNNVYLPIVYSGFSGVDNESKSIGTWELVSHNPDSIFINAPESPFFGTYKIELFRDEGILYKIELSNDSTFIVCIKGSMYYKK